MVTYRWGFLLCLLRYHVDVPIVSHHGYRWGRLRRYVCENAVVVRSATSWAIVAVTDALVVLREQRAERSAENRLGWCANDGGGGYVAVRVAIVVGEGE